MRKFLIFIVAALFVVPALAEDKTWNVHRSSTSVVLDGIKLYDATDGINKITNITEATAGLEISVWDGKNETLYAQSATNIEDITTALSCVQDDGGVFTNDTTDCNSAAANDVAYPATPAAADRLLFGYGGAVDQICIDVGTAGTGTYTITWKYRITGSAWFALASPTDGTNSFKTSGLNCVTFTKPTDGVSDTFDSRTENFWVAAEIDGGTTTIDPLLSVVTFPVGNWSAPTASKARFEAVDDGGYQIHFADTIFSNTSTEVFVVIEDTSSPTFMDWNGSIYLDGLDAADIESEVNDGLIAYSAATATNVTDSESNITDLIGSPLDTDITTDIANLGLTVLVGTCDSGSTTTCVDATLTEADTDYWAKNVAIVFTSGTAIDQSACVTGFTPGSDTLTFSPATTQAISTNTYTLRSDGGCGAIPDAGSIVAATFGAGAIDAAAIGTDAIDADAIATAAIGALEIATGAFIAAKFATDSITSDAIATGAIDINAMAASSIDATVLATNAIGALEMSDAAIDKIWDEVVETGTPTITARCMMQIIGAYAGGEWTQSGSVITYQDSGGNGAVIVGTIQSPGFDTITITCP